MANFDECMAELLRLDDAGRHRDMLAVLLDRRPDGARAHLSHATPLGSDEIWQIEAAITNLWSHERFEAAACLGAALRDAGHDTAIAHLAGAIGEMFGDRCAGGTDHVAAVARCYAAMLPAQQMFFVDYLLSPAVCRLLSVAHDFDRVTVLLQLLELIKIYAPALREVFDWQDAKPPSIGAARSGAAAAARPGVPPIRYRSPPPQAPRRRHRMVVAARRHFQNDPANRLFDMGPRLVHAANAYGWQAGFCDCALLWQDLTEDFAAILAHCRDARADILLLDDDFIQEASTHAARRELIAALRLLNPSIKIVTLRFDGWHIPPEVLVATAADVDAIWTTTPAMPVWRDPVFAGKILQAPFPHAVAPRAPGAAAPARISFVGSLMAYNWPRIFWRAASVARGLPIDWQVSNRLDDGLPPLDSYRDFMDRLGAVGCTVNFAMRKDYARIITGRSFEAMLAGALLLQEEADDLDYFFVAGEHYLPFRSFADLRDACDLVTRDPARAQKIRRAGHAFAVARYADDRLIGYLDALLFHPAPAAPRATRPMPAVPVPAVPAPAVPVPAMPAPAEPVPALLADA
jgi:hypothetical protein